MNLRVSGGATGIAARIEDMRLEADVLDRRGDELRVLAGRVGGVLTTAPYLASVPFSPLTAGQVVTAVGAAQLPPTGLLWLSAQCEGLAFLLRGAAITYEMTDAALAMVGQVVDTVTGVVVIEGVLVYVLGSALAYRIENVLPDWLTEAVVPSSVSDWLEEHGSDPLATGMGLIYDHPWITESIVAGLPAFVAGLSLTGRAVLPGGLGYLLPVPLSYEHLLSLIIAGGGLAGYFATGTPSVTKVDSDQYTHEDAPRSIAQIFQNISNLTGWENEKTRVQVTAVPTGVPGEYTWIVEIPGTTQWDGTPNSDPSDLGANLRLMAGSETAIEQGVLAAIQAAAEEMGVDPSALAEQSVMLAGHSQGGIVATSIASNPDNGLNITHVITGGSPVGNFDVPPGVQVLSIEHDQDPVPKLDGNPNPESSNRTTIHRDVSDSTDDGQPGQAHSGRLYAETGEMIDEQAPHDPALSDFYADLEDPFGKIADGQGEVFQFDIEQEFE